MFYAMILLGIAALGGLVMAGMRFAGALRPPTWLAMLHSLLAAAGMTLRIQTALTAGVPTMAQIGLCILLLAAVGGAALNLLYHSRQLALPKSWVTTHASLAIIGFALVLVVAV